MSIPTEAAAPTPNRLSSLLRVLLVAATLLAVGAVVFAPFLVGDKVLLYKSTGSDSLNEDYPYAVHFSEYVRSDGFPRWSFQLGIGQSVYAFAPYLLFNPVAWLPKSAIAAALPYQQLLKVLVAGLLFFRFLQLRGLNGRSSLGGALFVAFSGYMCFGACWSIIGNELIGFSFLLVAIETALTRGRWAYVPCAVALLGFLTVFHLYLSAMLLCLYVPTRLVSEHGATLRPMLRWGVPLAIAAALGCGLAAVIAFHGFAVVLDSPRAPGTTSGVATLAGQPIFALESWRHWLTAAARWLSTDLLGTGPNYRGWSNYFEAPITYCGLLSLVLAPQAFINANRRGRLFCALFAAFLIVPVVFPWFRYAFWAFQGNYYRTYSLFSLFGMVTLGMTAFSRYAGQRRLHYGTLAATVVLLLATLWLPTLRAPHPLVPPLQIAASAYILAYAVLLSAGRFFRQCSRFAWAILALGAVELIHFDHITVAERNVLTKSELGARTGYNDFTVDAIRRLEADDQTFYRVSKDFSSSPAIHYGLNDDMVFGYFGTGGYSSFNDMDHIRFLAALDVIPSTPSETDTRWAPGLWNRPYLATFMGEKYFLTRNPAMFAKSAMYEFLARYGDVHVYRNTCFVPFGLSFDRYVPLSEFLQWPASAKEHALFYATVIADQDLKTRRDVGGMALTRMDLRELSTLVKAEPLEKTLALHRHHGTALKIDAFTSNAINGTVDLARGSVMVFQTAFAPGWRASVDGARVPTLKVDVGLIGFAITPGQHRIRLEFVPRFLELGAVVSSIALGLFAFALWRWPRIPAAQRAGDAANLG